MPDHTRVYVPRSLSKGRLDKHLAQGWYRIGQTLMTCRFLVFEEQLRSTIWTRLDLREHSFRKGQRKHLRRIRREFRVRVQPATVDAARERIYQAYRVQARGDRTTTAADVLMLSGSLDLFDTWEVSLWRGDELVAFSWFDLGRKSLQSIMGAYPPEESKWGLGYATMLLEMEWGQEHGFHYHYTGYVMPGEPAMDYKLRAGEMQWLTQDGAWRPWETFDPAAAPLAAIDDALTDVLTVLEDASVPARKRDYLLFEASTYDRSLASCYDEPRVVEVFPLHHAVSALFVAWDLDAAEYRVTRVRRASGVMRPPDPARRPRQVELFMREEDLGHSSSAAGVLAILRSRLGME